MEKNMDTNFDFNNTEKFDFGKVGKRMPYSTPVINLLSLKFTIIIFELD
jgi:hypothetical protein